MNISLDTLKQAVEIKEEIETLEARLNKILGGDGGGAMPIPFSEPAKRGRRGMSASARARIAAAQRARWAKLKGTSSSIAKAVKKGRRKMSASARARIAASQRARWAKLKGTSPVEKPAKKKGGITAAGRARLAAAMKARWPARKKGAPALNAPKRK